MVRPAVSRSPSSLPRHVALDGQANFRDLGGYETTDGRRIAWGRVYRSGYLAMLSDADVSRLEDLGIRTIVNLLTGDDIERYGPGRVPAGAREVSLGIESDLPRRATAALHSGDFSSVPPGLNPESPSQPHRGRAPAVRRAPPTGGRPRSTPVGLPLLPRRPSRRHGSGHPARRRSASPGRPFERTTCSRTSTARPRSSGAWWDCGSWQHGHRASIRPRST